MPYKDPEKRREAKRRSARRRREAETGRRGPSPHVETAQEPRAAAPSGSTAGRQDVDPVDPVPLETAGDVLALLGEEIGAVRADPEAATLPRARCVAYLAGVAMRALETSNLEERIARLEEEADLAREAAALGPTLRRVGP